jgi:hypothetical protein
MHNRSILPLLTGYLLLLHALELSNSDLLSFQNAQRLFLARKSHV